MFEITNDFKNSRHMMVEGQIRLGKVKSKKLCKVMDTIPREAYVPEEVRAVAYMDKAIPLGIDGRFIMQPYHFALLVELANVQETDLVLDIACATGYSTAVLASLAGIVIGLDENKKFVELAKKNIEKQSIENAVIVSAPHTMGEIKQSPYDIIFINGFVQNVSKTLLQQLVVGGRLVCVGYEQGMQRAMVITREKNHFSKSFSFDMIVPPVSGFEYETQFEF